MEGVPGRHEGLKFARKSRDRKAKSRARRTLSRVSAVVPEDEVRTP